MEALGGAVYRTPKSTVQEDQWKRDTTAARAQLEQLKAEHARARADRKAKLQAQIESLSRRIDAKVARAQARSQQVTRELQARVEALQRKAEKKKGDARVAFDARIARLRNDYQNRQHA
jgi:hypothetical protein